VSFASSLGKILEMKAQPILLVSGLLLFGGGTAALFAPQEIAALLRAPSEGTNPLLVQLLGAGLFALGFLDWVSRFSSIGGIYGRPVLLANFAYFFTATATLLHHASASGSTHLEWLFVGISAVLAIWYARYLFFPPKPVTK
jgi:hypothetical protein